MGSEMCIRDRDTVVLALATAAAVDKRRTSMMGTGCRWDGLSLPCEQAMGVGVFRLLRILGCPRSWLGSVGPLRLIPAVFDISPGAYLKVRPLVVCGRDNERSVLGNGFTSSSIIWLSIHASCTCIYYI